ncbi:hypothetical protein Cni_G07102 [Canna indica]|uniref:Uncharacterized protein n=1 Tax=Canna indica TaxID=4628 RepID=A0AAQ3JYI9_9LILI|nr:hypothetical protein Cni_G07102 [Canna indica]
MEEKEEYMGLSDDEVMHLRILQKKTEALCKQIQIKWWSKARMKWVNEGERNSKYYHNLVKLKRNRADIEKLVVDDIALSDNKEMVEAFAVWYENLWKQEGDDRELNVLDRIQWRKIDQQKADFIN